MDPDIFSIDIARVVELNKRLDAITNMQNSREMLGNLKWVAKFFKNLEGANMFSLLFSEPTLLRQVEEKMALLNGQILPKINKAMKTQRVIACNIRLFLSAI